MNHKHNKEEKYYSDFYESGEYQIREKDKMGEEIQYILSRIDKYYPKGDCKCLEVGSGGGALQDIVTNYTGLDLASSVEKYYHKPFIHGSATDMPIEDNAYDVIWSIAAIEHFPEPEKCFDEMIRVCKNHGHLLLSPAWHCRRWAAQGYEVRPYSDFNIIGRIYKALIPFLDWIVVRAIAIIPVRVFGIFLYLITKKNGSMPFIYSKLNAQYEVHRVSDDDACNSMDPFMAILYFESRGHKCLSHDTFKKKITSTHGFLDIEIIKK